MGKILIENKIAKPENRNEKAETIIVYEEHYMKLIQKYKQEIQEIQEMLKSIRDERQQFFLETLPQIETAMKNDEVLSEEAKKEWIQELRHNMEKSFSVSEELVNHYVTSNLNEFKQKLKDAVNGV